MKKGFLKGIAALLALSTVLSVASCGKKDVVEDGVVEITMWSGISEDAEPVDKEIDAYTDQILAEKFPNIKINKVVKTMGTDYRQEYDKAFAKYFVAFNDLISKRFDAGVKLPKAITKIANDGAAEEVQPGSTSTFSAGSLWSQITSGVQQNGQNEQNSNYMPSLWYQTMQGVEDNSSYYTDYYQDHSYGENGIGVGGWIILIILVMIIFSQSHPVRRANNRYKKNHGGKGWIYGLLGVALIRLFRRR